MSRSTAYNHPLAPWNHEHKEENGWCRVCGLTDDYELGNSKMYQLYLMAINNYNDYLKSIEGEKGD